MLIHRLLLSLFVAAAPDPPVVVLAEEGIVSGSEWSLNARGQVSVLSTTQVSEGAPAPALLDVAMARLSELPLAVRGEISVFLRLRNGEVLRGRLQGPGSPDRVMLDAGILGIQQVAMLDISAIRIGPTGLGGGAPDARPPFVLLANGDVIAGAVRGLKPSGIVVASEFGDTEIGLDRVMELVFSSEAPATDGRRDGQLICTIADGQRWYVDELTAGGRPGHVRVRRGDATADLPVSAVRQVLFADWTIRELVATGDPRIETTPYLDEGVRVDVDDAARHRPRAIGSRWFTCGITARPWSRVTYSSESDGFLIGWVGMDSLRGRLGNCDVGIEIGNTPVFSRQGMTARDGARRFAVVARSPGRISLITDFGANGEVGDCVNWCEPLLVEKRRSAATRGH